MPCNPLNATINRYEAWSHGNCAQKQLLVRTAPFPLVTLIVGKIGQEIFVNLIWRNVIKTFINMGAIAIRVLVCKFKCKEQLKVVANAPLNIIRTLGRIVRLVECILYSIVAFVALKPALAQFRAAGLFRSNLEIEEVKQNLQYAFDKGRKLQFGFTGLFVEHALAEKNSENSSLTTHNRTLIARINELETALNSEAGIANNAINQESGVANHAISALQESLRKVQHNLETVQEEKAALVEELEKKKNEGVALAQNVMDRKNVEINKLKAEIETIDAKLTDALNAKTELERDKTELSNRIKQLSEFRISDLSEKSKEPQGESSNSTHPAEVEELRAQLSQKEDQAAHQESQLRDLKETLTSKDKELQALEEELQKSRAEFAASQEELSLIKDQLGQKEELLTDLESKLKSLKGSLEATVQKVNELDEELLTTKQKLEKAEREVQELQSIQDPAALVDPTRANPTSSPTSSSLSLSDSVGSPTPSSPSGNQLSKNQLKKLRRQQSTQGAQ